MRKRCVLDDSKYCTHCGECNICDLDPNKICDNCGKCLDAQGDYKEIVIEAIVTDPDEEILIQEELKDAD